MAADSDAVVGAYGSPNERVVAHCRVLLEWGETVYLSCVTWRMSFETAPVTESLVSVTANLRMAEFGTLFKDIADCFGYPCSLEMATGSGRLHRKVWC